MVKRTQEAIRRFFVGLILMIGFVFGAHSVDNPEASDLIAEFEKQEVIYLTQINNPDNSTRDFLIAYDDYLIFLKDELNKALEQLNLKLPENRRAELVIAQQHWVNYRDAEFELIKNTWTRKDFGSSAGISRGDYRTSIVKDRLMQLFHYIKNF